MLLIFTGLAVALGLIFWFYHTLRPQARRPIPIANPPRPPQAIHQVAIVRPFPIPVAPAPPRNRTAADKLLLPLIPKRHGKGAGVLYLEAYHLTPARGEPTAISPAKATKIAALIIQAAQLHLARRRLVFSRKTPVIMQADPVMARCAMLGDAALHRAARLEEHGHMRRAIAAYTAALCFGQRLVRRGLFARDEILGVGLCRAAIGTPEHGLLALYTDQTLFDNKNAARRVHACRTALAEINVNPWLDLDYGAFAFSDGVMMAPDTIIGLLRERLSLRGRIAFLQNAGMSRALAAPGPGRNRLTDVLQGQAAKGNPYAQSAAAAALNYGHIMRLFFKRHAGFWTLQRWRKGHWQLWRRFVVQGCRAKIHEVYRKIPGIMPLRPRKWRVPNPDPPFLILPVTPDAAMLYIDTGPMYVRLRGTKILGFNRWLPPPVSGDPGTHWNIRRRVIGAITPPPRQGPLAIGR